VPVGGTEMHTAGGAVVRTRVNGVRSDIYDPARGMAIHRGLNGGRLIEVERPDRSRIVVDTVGRGFVQHPYRYGNAQFEQRTYVDHGRTYDRFYRERAFRGLVLELYTPSRYYPVGFYGWAYRPWGVATPYAWGWARAPWYGYYGHYFTPYPAYASGVYWLTDYLIAASLQSAYAAQSASGPPPALAPAGTATLSPEVKEMIAQEVQQDVQQEAVQAGANAAATNAAATNPPPAPPTVGVLQRLSDNAPHVFMAGTNIDLVDASGKECAIGPGDVLLVSMAPLPAATTADATILSSKGATECAASAMVMVSLTDLQEMQNHVRETLDDGLAQLQSQQGQAGLPAAPAGAAGDPMPATFTAGAPAPDAMAQAEIAQQSQAADQAEADVASAKPNS
jgi:hypothetical protein